MSYVKRNNLKSIIIPVFKYMNLLYKYMLLTYFTVFSNNNDMTTSKILKQTASLRKEDIKKDWLLIDANDIVLGRLATNVSNILRGKHKPTYTPHVDCGDNVVIINAEKIKLTGKKLDDKTYYRHTGYPGGIKSINARKILEGKFPDRLVRLAVKRMIPKGPLGRKQLSNMKVYVGDKHPHESQNPKTYNIQDVVK